MKVILVAGARPNFMKIAPIMRAMDNCDQTNGVVFDPFLVHTGQHYDDTMSKVFFHELNIPKPDINLEVGSGTHAEQTAAALGEAGHQAVAVRPVEYGARLVES